GGAEWSRPPRPARAGGGAYFSPGGGGALPRPPQTAGPRGGGPPARPPLLCRPIPNVSPPPARRSASPLGQTSRSEEESRNRLRSGDRLTPAALGFPAAPTGDGRGPAGRADPRGRRRLGTLDRGGATPSPGSDRPFRRAAADAPSAVLLAASFLGT